MRKYEDDTSMYFRLPESIKLDFDHICNVDRTTKTHTLNTFIRGFIDAKLEENKELYKRPVKREWTVRRLYQ